MTGSISILGLSGTVGADGVLSTGLASIGDGDNGWLGLTSTVSSAPVVCHVAGELDATLEG